MDLSIVIPIYNEEGNLPSLIEQIRLKMNSDYDEKLSWECILVDDGSQDNSWQRMHRLTSNDTHFKFIKLRRNSGQTAALAAGIRGAKGSWVATLDGDMQNDPDDIIPLYRKAQNENWDVVSGWRKNRKDPFLRSQVSKIANRLVSRISGLELNDYGCSMKIYRKSILNKLQLYGEMHRFLPIYASLKGARVCEMIVNHRARESGESKYGFLRITRVLVDMLIFYFLFHSGKPFQFFMKAALFIMATGFFLLIMPLFNELSNGWITFNITTGLILLQTASFSILFGLILELILRTHYLTQKETQYEIISIVNLESHPDLNLAGPVDS